MKKILFTAAMVAGLAGFSSASYATLTCLPEFNDANCGGMGTYCVDDNYNEFCVAPGMMLSFTPVLHPGAQPKPVKNSLPLTQRKALVDRAGAMPKQQPSFIKQ